jgi:hypothetical protein
LTASVVAPEPGEPEPTEPEPATEPESSPEPEPEPTTTPEPSTEPEPMVPSVPVPTPEPSVEPSAEPAPEPTVEPEPAPTCIDQGPSFEAEYQRALDAARGCDLDSDCVAVGGDVALPCRCEVYVAVDADLTELERLVALTAPCPDDCLCAEPTTAAPRCVEGMCTAPDDAEMLCQTTGGTWRTDACAPFTCGIPGRCASIVPGCDCGSCGHYTCGQPPDCDAIIPGCNCGPDGNFTGFGEVDSGCN